MAAVIGALRVNLSADTAEFRRQLSEAERISEKFGRSIGTKMRAGVLALGAAATAGAVALGALIKSSMDTIDTQAKLAGRVGGTVAALQGLQHAADLAGVGSEQLTKGLEMLNRRLGEAAREGAGNAFEALQRLGLSASELAAMDVDQRISTLSDRMKELGYTTQQQADTLGQFGIRNQAMINLFQEGSEAIKQARADLDAWGVTLSDIDAKKVEAANDAISRIGSVMEGIGNQLAIRLAPIIQAIAEYFTDAAKETGGFGSILDQAISMGIHLFAAINREIYDFRISFDEIAAAILNFFDAIAGAPANLLAKVFGGEAEDYGFKPVNESFGKLKDMLAKPPSDEEWDAWFAELKRKADETAAAALAKGTTLSDEDSEASQKLAQKRTDELVKYQEHLAQKLDTLKASLATERETELAAYEQRQTDLEDFYARNMISEQEYRDLLLRSQQEYAEKIRQIDEEIAKDNERAAKRQRQAYFQIADDITSALGTLFGESKTVAIAQAIINTAQAVTRTLAEYGATPLGLAAAAAAAAAGAAEIATIRSTNRSGGGGGRSTTPAVSAPVTSPAQQGVQSGLQQTLFVSGINPGDVFSGDTLRDLVQKLIDYQRDGGKVVLTPS